MRKEGKKRERAKSNQGHLKETPTGYPDTTSATQKIHKDNRKEQGTKGAKLEIPPRQDQHTLEEQPEEPTEDQEPRTTSKEATRCQPAHRQVSRTSSSKETPKKKEPSPPKEPHMLPLKEPTKKAKQEKMELPK